jgi:hypothetical protein
MLSRAVFAASLLLMVALVPQAVAQPDMQEGEWEITTKVEMPGLPFALPPIKSRACITKEDLVPPPPEKKGEACTMKEMRSKGDTVTWEMECKEKKSTTHSKGEIVYRKDSFTGTIVATVQSSDGTQVMNQQLSGRRLGPCK